MLPAHERLQVLHPRGPGDVVELIPYLLGYHPSGSIVMVDMGPHDRRVGVKVLRVDLDEVLADPEWVGEMCAEFAGCAAVMVVIYGSAQRSTATLFPRF